MFADGPKDPVINCTGAAVSVFSYRVDIYKRTTDYLSVYTVELYAILMALEWVE